MSKIRSFLIVIITVLIIIIICLSKYIGKLKFEKSEPYNMEGMEYLLQNKIYPNNFKEFYFNYKGSVNTTEIYNKFNFIIIEKIPDIYSNINNLQTDEQIEKFFTEKQYIIKSMGIDNISDFRRLVNILKMYNISELDYLYCELEKASCKKYSDRTEFDLKIVYKNTDKIIRFNVIIFNEVINDNFIKIIPLVEE